MMIEALANLASKDDKWLDILAGYTNNSNPNVCATTIITLGKTGKYSPQVIESLKMLLSNETYVKQHETTIQQLAYDALYRIHISSGNWIPVDLSGSD